MTTRSRIAYLLYAGLLGGAAAGGLVSLLWLLAPDIQATVVARDAFQGALIGACLGIYLGAVEGIANHELARALWGAAVFGLSGIAGGAIGVICGGTLFRGVAGFLVDIFPAAAHSEVSLGLSLGWLILGASLGASSGLLIRSPKRAMHGLIGGAAGGALGGIAFHALYSRQTPLAVCMGLALLGGAIGMGIALVEDLLVGLVIRVKKGRHEGREYPIYRPIATIGRDDRCDVCLSGCEGVSLFHARLKRDGSAIVIEDMSPEIGIYVNDVRKKRAVVTDGDLIRVGSVLLEVKKGASQSPSRASAAAAAILAMGLIWPMPSSADGTTMRITQFDLSGYPHTRAYLSIQAPDGSLVRGVTAPEISLQENGRSLSIEEFIPAIEEKGRFCAALVLDKSGSMEGEKIQKARDSVETFLKLMEPGDQAVLIPFSDRVDASGDLTGDREGLLRALAGIRADGHTALFDAIITGVEKIKARPGRRTVIVLTDGKANRGRYDIGDAIKKGVQENTSIYIIGLGEDVRTERLEKIAQSSGGRYFFTPSPQELKGIYESISKEIKGEYILGYRAPDTGEYVRTLKVALRSSGKGGMKAEAERPYFQPSSSLFGAASAARMGIFYPISLIILTAILLGVVGLRKIEHDKLCPSCGAEVRAKARFCPGCGEKIKK